MPLTIAPIGVLLKIVKIVADEKMKKHLNDLGLIIGEQIQIINSIKGSVVIELKDGRLALDKELSSKIFVG